MIKKPYLFWSTKDPGKLSSRAFVEAILNYGNWSDFVTLEKKFGIKELKSIFESSINKKRINLRPQVVNYFKNYFKKYA